MNSLCSNNQSGVGRQSVAAFHSTTASPPTLQTPLQSGKTADIFRCRSGVHRLAFRLSHCLGRIHGLRLLAASVNAFWRHLCSACVTKKRSAAETEVRKRPSTPCRVKSLLCVGCAAKKRHGGFRRRIKEDRCRDFSLSPKAGRLDHSLPHRPAGAIIRHAPSGAVRRFSLVIRNIIHNLNRNVPIYINIGTGKISELMGQSIVPHGFTMQGSSDIFFRRGRATCPGFSPRPA